MHCLSVNVLKTEPDKGNREREGSFKREFNSNVIILLETVDPLTLKFSMSAIYSDTIYQELLTNQ